MPESVFLVTMHEILFREIDSEEILMLQFDCWVDGFLGSTKDSLARVFSRQTLELSQIFESMRLSLPENPNSESAVEEISVDGKHFDLQILHPVIERTAFDPDYWCHDDNTFDVRTLGIRID